MQPEFILQPALLWLLLLDLVLLGTLIAVRPGALLRPSVFFSIFVRDDQRGRRHRRQGGLW